MRMLWSADSPRRRPDRRAGWTPRRPRAAPPPPAAPTCCRWRAPCAAGPAAGQEGGELASATWQQPLASNDSTGGNLAPGQVLKSMVDQRLEFSTVRAAFATLSKYTRGSSNMQGCRPCLPDQEDGKAGRQHRGSQHDAQHQQQSSCGGVWQRRRESVGMLQKADANWRLIVLDAPILHCWLSAWRCILASARAPDRAARARGTGGGAAQHAPLACCLPDADRHLLRQHRQRVAGQPDVGGGVAGQPAQQRGVHLRSSGAGVGTARHGSAFTLKACKRLPACPR